MNSPWWLRFFLNFNSGKSRRFIVALNLDDKKAIVAEVNETAAQAMSLVIADARGVDVTNMTALRAKARAIARCPQYLGKKSIRRHRLRMR
jgi:ribosomal protein L10